MANNPSQIKPVYQTADVPAGHTVTPASDISINNNKKEEIQMAEVITGTTTGFVNNQQDVIERQVSDLRREVAQDAASIQLENMKGFDRVNADVLKSGWDNSAATKDARYDIGTRIGEAVSTLSGGHTASDNATREHLWSLNRDIMDSRAQIAGLGYQIRDGFVAAGKDAEINALKTQIDIAKQATYISDKIDAGNQRTTDLINALRDSDQNRMLVERNTELVGALADGRWNRDWGHFRDDWGRFRGGWDNNTQVVANRLNSLDSQLQDTRQGMVNFGTMAGVGQSSTSNNVK